jgi:hypothetical protein
MSCTIDLSTADIDCVARALTTHVDITTETLRSRIAPQLSAAEAQRLVDDIRIAAVLIGRLAFYRHREPA